MADHRPWGYYVVLADEEDHKVKRIVLYPGKRFSLQRHEKRNEHWYLISGEAIATIDKREFAFQMGGHVNIPRGTLHRLENAGDTNVVFIEVQTGEYFGEDDIERIDDDFGRA